MINIINLSLEQFEVSPFISVMGQFNVPLTYLSLSRLLSLSVVVRLWHALRSVLILEPVKSLLPIRVVVSFVMIAIDANFFMIVIFIQSNRLAFSSYLFRGLSWSQYFVTLLIVLSLITVRTTVYSVAILALTYYKGGTKPFGESYGSLYSAFSSRILFRLVWIAMIIVLYLNNVLLGELVWLSALVPLLSYVSMIDISTTLTELNGLLEEVLTFIQGKYVAHCEEAVAKPRCYIPYNITDHQRQGYIVCAKMMESSKTVSPRLYEYLVNNLQYMTVVPEGDTLIPVEIADPKHLASLSNTVALENNYSVHYLKFLSKNTRGVYAFFDDADVVQCGSSINMDSRLELHYQECPKVDKSLYSDALASHGGLSAYKFVPLMTVTNHSNTFKLMYQDADTRELYILRAFLQQEVRVLEQSYSVFRTPRCFKGIDINLWHLNWTPDTALADSKGFEVIWLDNKGGIFTAPSLKQAARMLDLNISTITRTANCITPYTVHSLEYGDVNIYIPRYPEKAAVDNTYVKPDLGVDLSHLTPNLYYLLDKDLIQLPMGPFKNIPEINIAIGLPEERQNWRWVNTTHLVTAPALGLLAGVHIVCNKVSTKMPATVTNLITGVVTHFASMYRATVSLHSGSRSAFLKTYVIGRKPYKDNLVEFANEEDHVSTKLRLARDKGNCNKSLPAKTATKASASHF